MFGQLMWLCFEGLELAERVIRPIHTSPSLLSSHVKIHRNKCCRITWNVFSAVQRKILRGSNFYIKIKDRSFHGIISWLRFNRKCSPHHLNRIGIELRPTAMWNRHCNFFNFSLPNAKNKNIISYYHSS